MAQSESYIEREVCEVARELGILSFKFVSPANRGVPDRIFLYRGISMFIEFKREGVHKMDPLQEAQAFRLISSGFIVQICNNVNQGRALLESFKTGIDNANTKQPA